jgi:BMFP domain-containing protein YqiC
MINAIGLNKLSDEEYLAQVREKRAAYLQRIAELEARLEEEKNSKHS